MIFFTVTTEVQEVCFAYVSMVPKSFIQYAGTGFQDFVQPIFQ